MSIHIHPSANQATRRQLEQRTGLIAFGNQLLPRDTKVAQLVNHPSRKPLSQLLTKAFSHHGHDFDPTTPTAA